MGQKVLFHMITVKDDDKIVQVKYSRKYHAEMMIWDRKFCFI